MKVRDDRTLSAERSFGGGDDDNAVITPAATWAQGGHRPPAALLLPCAPLSSLLRWSFLTPLAPFKYVLFFCRRAVLFASTYVVELPCAASSSVLLAVVRRLFASPSNAASGPIC